MYRTIARFQTFELTSYTLLLTLSFVLGILWVWSRSRTRGVNPSRMLLVATGVSLAAVAGARLAYVLTHWESFQGALWNTVNIYQNGVLRLAGLQLNGGIILAFLTVWMLAVRSRLPVLKTLDIFAPALALGIFLTRLGCFLNGCCYGLPTNLPWGVLFPTHTAAGVAQAQMGGMSVHPTQLYSAAYGLAILLVLIWWEKREQRFEGSTAILLFLLYACCRFGVEFLRSPVGRPMLPFSLNSDQYLSIGMFLGAATALVVLLRLEKTSRRFPLSSTTHLQGTLK